MNEAPNTARIREEFNVRGNQVVAKIKELIAAGNVRHITIRRNGRVIAEFPLTVGVIGTLIAPQIAVLGTLVALVAQCTIEVVRVDRPMGTSP